MPLSAKDLATIDRFHAAFTQAGLSLQFTSTGRPAREYYPTYRDLLLETRSQGPQALLPGFGGRLPVRARARRPRRGHSGGRRPERSARRRRGRPADGRSAARSSSAFYVSNVENYLFRNGAYTRYIENLKRLPHSDRSVLIRSIFGGYSLPESAPGYYSTSTVQNLNELLANCAAGKCRSYFELLRR